MPRGSNESNGRGAEVGQKRKQWRRVNWNGWTGPIQAVAGGQCEFACWMRRNGMERMDRILSLDFGWMEKIAQEIAPFQHWEKCAMENEHNQAIAN